MFLSDFRAGRNLWDKESNPLTLQIRKPRSRDTLWLAGKSYCRKSLFVLVLLQSYCRKRLLVLVFKKQTNKQTKNQGCFYCYCFPWDFQSSVSLSTTTARSTTTSIASIVLWMVSRVQYAYLKEAVRYTVDPISLNVWATWNLQAKWVDVSCLVLPLVGEEVPKTEPSSLSQRVSLVQRTGDKTRNRELFWSIGQRRQRPNLSRDLTYFLCAKMTCEVYTEKCVLSLL